MEEQLRIISELEEMREAKVKHFMTEKNHSIAAVYPHNIHFVKDGKWEEINNELEEVRDETGTPYLQNKMSDTKVRFAKTPESDKLITLKKDGYTVEWEFLSVKVKSLGRDIALKAKEFKYRGIEKIKPKTEFLKAGQDIEQQNLEIMKISKSECAGVYEDILPDVDIQYLINGDVLKENIILKSKDAALTPVRFSIKHEGLMVREENAEVLLCEKDEPAKVVYRFAVPYMYDAVGNYSDKVSYKITTENESSILETVADEQWMLSEERVYPVVIDPVTETSKSSKSIDDTFVREKYPTSSITDTFGSFYVANNSGYGKCRAFLRFTNLPQMEKGSIIYDARMYVWQYKYSEVGSTGFKIAAHKVTGGWTPGSTTWNNKPAYDGNVIDYAHVANTNGYIQARAFNITKLVREWYNTGTNNGIMLKMMDESKSAEAVFVTSDYPANSLGITSEMFPSGVFYYKNVNGLEDYQSYHEQSVGHAGTGYTNDYTGNIVFMHEDAKTTGNLLPISVNHVYNLSESATPGRMGNGWRLSVMQELNTTGISDFPYVYTDEDGTKHYFYKDSDDGNKLKDEDGLGLVITVTSSSNNDEYRTIETQDKLKYVFGSDGYLRRIKDLDGNVTSFNYGPNAKGNYISTLVDASGETIKFHYTSDMTRLASIEDSAGRHTRFTYSGDNVISIQEPDARTAKFAYTGSQMIKAESADGDKIEYELSNDFKVKRVTKISEYGKNSVPGQVLKISYTNGNVTRFEEMGLDGNISTTADNKVYTYHFDNTGRPVSIHDEEGNANSYAYFKEGMKNNKLSKEGETQKAIINYIQNPRFDPAYTTVEAWTNGIQSGDTITRDTTDGYLGKRCLKVYKKVVSGETGVWQNPILSAQTNTYTFSAYVKTSNIVTSSGGGVYLQITVENASTGKRVIRSQMLTGTTDRDIDNGWERISVTASAVKGESIYVAARIMNATGTAWFDCFQLERGNVANKFNMLSNVDFSNVNGNSVRCWSREVTGTTTDGVENTSDRGTCGMLTGDVTKRKQFGQSVSVAGEEGDVYALCCWLKANAVPERDFKLQAEVIYEDNTTKLHDIACNPHVTDWQFVSGCFTTDDSNSATKKKYKEIRIFVVYTGQANKLLVDKIQLIKDDAESFVYDSSGNLISAKSAAENSKFSHDNNNNISKVGETDGTEFEYGYNAKNNLSHALNSEGVQYKYEYDGKGNVTGTTAWHIGKNEAITIGKSYIIRQKKSGKCISVPGGVDANGTWLQQWERNGTNRQTFRVEDAGGGYVKFVAVLSATGRVIDVANAASANGSKLDLYQDNGTDAQKFRIKPLDNNTYQILAKCTNDKRAVSMNNGSIEAGQAITIWDQSENDIAQQWYIIPADGEISVQPVSGKTYQIRARHSGQCMDIHNADPNVNANLVQYYTNTNANQQFKTESVGSDFFMLRPMHAPDKALSVIGTASGSSLPIKLKAANAADTSQHFKFVKAGDDYGIMSRNSNLCVEVQSNSYDIVKAIVASPYTGTYNSNMRWIFEEYSEKIQSSATYTADGRHIKTQTDPSGNKTENVYDSANRLLTGIIDPAGNKTSYTYNQHNDKLLSIAKTVSGQELKNSYTYDGDKLKTISHNGFSYTFEYDAYGNSKSIKVGTQAIETKAYMASDGPLASLTYGNGAVISNVYDKNQNVIEQKLNNVTRYKNTYDSYGDSIVHEDIANGITSRYQYDLLNRIIGFDDTRNHRIKVAYDKKNRVDYVVTKVSGQGIKTQFVYGDVANNERPGLIYGVKVDDKQRVKHTYDSLARNMYKDLVLDSTNFRTTFTYRPGTSPGMTTTQVASVKNGNNTLSYTYDVLGNIKTISENGVLKLTYHYDEISQLIREDSVYENKTYVYAYDKGGNMLSRKAYSYTLGTPASLQATVAYEYSDSNWKDKMTKYNGQSITYDAIGNPLNYRDSYQMTWIKGRLLSGLKKDGLQHTYNYDCEGRRIRKTVNGTSTNYYLNGDDIMTEISGSTRLDYIYDESNELLGFKYQNNYYFYVKNLQGDIIGILDKAGATIVSYIYDAWGKLLQTTGTSAGTIGKINPFRYRGYYYDTETGLYYLNSRYYDPEVRRFINADDLDVLDEDQDSLIENNLFAYCLNNPVKYRDQEGELPFLVGQALISAAFDTAIYLVSAKISNKKISGKELARVAIIGAISGAIGGKLGAIIAKKKSSLDIAKGLGKSKIGKKFFSNSMKVLRKIPKTKQVTSNMKFYKKVARKLLNYAKKLPRNEFNKFIRDRKYIVMPFKAISRFSFKFTYRQMTKRHK